MAVWTEAVYELQNSVANLSGISEESASAFKNALSVYYLGLSPEAHASMTEVARAISNTMKNRNELVFSGLTETISQFAELSKMMQPVSDSTRNLAKLLSEALNSNVESSNKSANKSANKPAYKSANLLNLVRLIQEAIEFILKTPTLAAFGGYDPSKMDEETIVEFVNELLGHLKVMSYRYQTKGASGDDRKRNR